MYKKLLLFGGISLGGIAVGAGASLAFILPKAIKAKKGLSNFVSTGGSYNSISGKDKINIVALGDSETAGYNGLMGRDYLSYADFLAQSFKNVGKLNSYHNFAYSGLRLSDFGKYVFEDANKVRVIKDADEILLTIGANDILSLVNFLGIPFGNALSMLQSGNFATNSSFANIVQDDKDKTTWDIKSDLSENNLKSLRSSFTSLPMGIDRSEEVFLERYKIFNDSPEIPFSKEDSLRVFKDTIKDFGELIKGNGQYLINLDKDWYPKVFDLVSRAMASLARDLHKIAPHAQIQLLGHAFPFVQFPKNIKEGKKPELGNTSLQENFNRLLNSMEEGMKKSLGDNEFVTYKSIDNIKAFKDANNKMLNFKGEDDAFYKSFVDNPMPNITDIHPSTYGHEIISRYLFEKLGSEIGLSKEQINSNSMKSYKPGTKNNPGTKYDETQWIRNDENRKDVINFKKNSSFINSMANIYEEMNSNPVFKSFRVGDFIENLFNEMQKPSDKKLTDEQINNTFPKEEKASLNVLKDILDVIPGLSEQINDLLFKSKLSLKKLKDNVNNDNVSRIEQYAILKFSLSQLINNIIILKSSLTF